MDVQIHVHTRQVVRDMRALRYMLRRLPVAHALQIGAEAGRLLARPPVITSHYTQAGVLHTHVSVRGLAALLRRARRLLQRTTGQRSRARRR